MNWATGADGGVVDAAIKFGDAVVPAKAGIQWLTSKNHWLRAFAGTTKFGNFTVVDCDIDSAPKITNSSIGAASQPKMPETPRQCWRLSGGFDPHADRPRNGCPVQRAARTASLPV